MSFENSPRLDEPDSNRLPFSSWVFKHRRLILAFTGLVLVFSVAIFVIQIRSALQAAVPGALDGCLETASGDPLVTTVRIGSITRPTYADGCFFFFPNIPPGQQEMIVSLPSGELSIPVMIISNQATALGTVVVNPNGTDEP
jgi:hypothetical protein